MSLETLKDMRLERLKPAIVNVVLGTTHTDLKDQPDYVVIGPNDKPEAMDMRPLVGLRITLIEIEGNDDLFERTIKALQEAGGRLDGIVSSAGPTGGDEHHEMLLRRLRERLCN